ncbi:MAG TPA: hypothetical protein VFS08_15000 [Gemmatimonadaceae bacterium]|nr:hypothetical protein [Gemmatimonadaceae bacterium]
MIARSWCGATRAADADAYLEYLHRTGLAEYRATPGNEGVIALRRIVGGRAEFLLLSLWTSMDAVRGFTGGDPDRAVFYPEDDRFLVARDEHVSHFEVVHRAEGRAASTAPVVPAAGAAAGAQAADDAARVRPRWAWLRELLREPLEPPRPC